MAGIQDKVVAITGASSRIGEAAAVMLAERGAKVVIRLHFLARSFPQLTDRRVCSSHPWTAVHFQRAKVVLGTRGLDRLEPLARRIAGSGGEVPTHAQTRDRARTCRVSSTWRMTVTASSRLLFVIAAAGKKNLKKPLACVIVL